MRPVFYSWLSKMVSANEGRRYICNVFSHRPIPRIAQKQWAQHHWHQWILSWLRYFVLPFPLDAILTLSNMQWLLPYNYFMFSEAANRYIWSLCEIFMKTLRYSWPGLTVIVVTANKWNAWLTKINSLGVVMEYGIYLLSLRKIVIFDSNCIEVYFEGFNWH